MRRRDDIIFVPVEQMASVVADGELLHLTTHAGDRHTITYRLKDLEVRLDPERLVRLSRGVLEGLDCNSRVSPMPGGTYLVTLANKQKLNVSRLRACYASSFLDCNPRRNEDLRSGVNRGFNFRRAAAHRVSFDR